MVYLIGVAHNIQYTNDKSNLIEIRQFADFLESKANQWEITFIGEELSKDVLQEKEATACTAFNVATKLGIEHRFCDPDRSERELLKIPSEKQIHLKVFLGNNNYDKDIKEEIRKEREKYFGLREQFWLERIKDKLNEPIFFICGADHIPSFESLLINKGYDVEVMVKDWAKETKLSN